jgi:hypothetical protein
VAAVAAEVCLILRPTFLILFSHEYIASDMPIPPHHISAVIRIIISGALFGGDLFNWKGCSWSGSSEVSVILWGQTVYHVCISYIGSDAIYIVLFHHLSAVIRISSDLFGGLLFDLGGQRIQQRATTEAVSSGNNG